jgi:hypothetical protein
MSCTSATNGSFVVEALVRQLRALNKEVDVVELMRRVQNDVLKKDNDNFKQTPQVSIFPHRPTLFCARLVNLFLIGVVPS